MPPLDFPNAPTLNQTYTGPNNTVWSWDGAKWLPASLSGTGYAPTLSPVFQGNPTAPTPPGGDADTSIATTAFVAPAFNNAGRNLLHNPLFNVAQRGAGPFTTSGYNLDRWSAFVGGSTVSVTQAALTDADRAAIGDEAARACFQCVTGGTAGTGDYAIVGQQMIEDVSRLSGKAIILSFWAKANAGTPKYGIDIYQYFGTGGSPSANVKLTAQAVTLSTTWTRYTTLWNIPSIAGKTLGTANNSATVVQPWMSSGATNNADAGGIGVQSYTLQLWGVQLEIGSVATPLEKPDPQQDLAKCQRFYQTFTALSMLASTGVAGQLFGQSILFPVLMRAAPTAAFNGIAYSNASALVPASVSSQSMVIYATSSITTSAQWTTNLTLTADL